MNRKQGTIVFVTFALYLIIGGTVFMTLENSVSKVIENPYISALEEFVELLIVNNETSASNMSITTNEDWNEHVMNVLENFTRALEPIERSPKWTFFDAIFFSLTVVTTIGYGNMSPSSEFGQLFCVFYGLFGIPLTGILLAGIGDFFSGKLLKIHEMNRNQSSNPKWSLFINTVMYLIPGFILFLFLPAGVFIALENWTFVGGLYYAFVTLTTIGFGDYVAATHVDETQWIYKLGLMAWIIFGLGYLAMILNFIAKAMKSKHVKKIEKRFAKNLKQTQMVLTKEMDYFMKSMNEFYMNKIKVIRNSGKMTRTSSCPSLDRPLDGSICRTNSITSIADLKTCDYVGHSETSANFLFDLAKAITCSDFEKQEEQGAISSRNGSIAHLLSLASMLPSPQLRSRSSTTTETNLSRTSLRRSLPPIRDYLLRGGSFLNKPPALTRVPNSSPFLNTLFPLSIGMLNPEDDLQRLQNEQCVNNTKMLTNNNIINNSNNNNNINNSKNTSNDSSRLMCSSGNPASFNYTDKIGHNSFKNKFCNKPMSNSDTNDIAEESSTNDENENQQLSAQLGGIATHHSSDGVQHNVPLEYWSENEITACSTIEEEKSDIESNTSPSVSVTSLSDSSDQGISSQETLAIDVTGDATCTDSIDRTDSNGIGSNTSCIINMDINSRNASTCM